MASIKVLYNNLVFKNVISNYTDFICERKLNGVGKFTLVINKNRLKIPFDKTDILFIREDSPYIVTEIKLIKSVDLKDELYTITGVELKGITLQRLTVPPTGLAEQVYTAKSTEYIVKDLVDKNLINATDTGRNIDFISNATNQDRGSVIDFRTRYKNLEVEIEQLLKAENMGYRINASGELDVYNLTDKTSDQSINNRVIFSIEKYKNLRQIEIDKNDGKNYGFTGGSGDGATRVIVGVKSDENLVARGKNLFNNNNYNLEKLFDAGGVLVSSANAFMVYIPCEKNTNYTISKSLEYTPATRFRVWTSNVIPAIGVSIYNEQYRDIYNTANITTDSLSEYLCVYIFNNDDLPDWTFDDVIATLQVELGSTATPYQPYIPPIGTVDGTERKETFFDVRDVTDTTELTEQGNQRLAEVQPTTIINGIVEQNNYEYLTDYDIGDLITFQDSEFGNLDMLITGAKEVYSGTLPVQVDLTFNYGVKNLAEILKINNKNINSEITK